jgi:hypothetical protein
MIQTFSVIVAFLRLTTAHVLWTEVVYAYLSWQVELWIGTLHLSIVGRVQAVNHMSVFCVVCGLQVWMLWSLLLIMQRLPLHLCKSQSFPRYAKDNLVLNILCDHLFLVIALLLVVVPMENLNNVIPLSQHRNRWPDWVPEMHTFLIYQEICFIW